MKKLASLVLALVMILAVMPAAVAEGDVVSFTYLPLTNGYGQSDVDENSWVEQQIEANLPGIDVIPVFTDWNNTEAISTMVYGGDLPDFSWLSKSYTITGMEENELIRTIPVEMLREYAPSWAALLDANPIQWAGVLDSEDNTQMRALPDFYNQCSGYLWCQFMRYDWAVASGIDLSSMEIECVSEDGLLYAAKKGISKEQLEQYLDYCVNGDPDGNGEADTMGYLKDYNKLLSGFSIIQGVMTDSEDGLAKPYYACSQMKEALAWIKDLYSKGLVNPEIFTIEWGADWDYITNGLAGFHGSAATNWLNTWANSRPPVTMFNQGIPMIILPGVCNDDGVTYRYMNDLPGEQNWGYIAKDVTDEQLIAILKFCEEVYFGNGDMAKTVTYLFGEEGVDFTWDEAGYPVANPDMTIEDLRKKGIGVFRGQIQTGIVWDWENLAPGSWYEQASEYFVSGGYWCEGNKRDAKVDLLNETDASSIYAEYSADWTEVTASYFQKVITGDADLEGDWDAYIESLNDSEFGAYIEELNKVEDLDALLASIG